MHADPQPYAPAIPFEERLNALAGSEEVARLGVDSDEVIAQTDVVLGTCKGHTELWIRPRAIDRLIHDWAHIKDDPSVRQMQVRDKSKPTTKRRAGPNGDQVPMYAFRMQETVMPAPLV